MSHSNVRKGILRYGPWARANHWIVAICFVLLTLSGLALFYPAFFGLTALFGGPDGMTIIDSLAGVAARLLKPGGICAVEHDDTTSQHTVDAFVRTGDFVDVTARHDLAGRPRFVTAVRAG